MSQQLQAYSITAPGFYGLNTQDSSLDLASGFALVANNCVIDQYGRVGARKGWSALNASTNADLGTSDIKMIAELVDNTGVSYTILAGNNKLYKFSGNTITTLTYGGGGTAPTITDSNWQAAALNGYLVLYQLGHEPLAFIPSVSTTTYRRISEVTGYAGTVQQSNAVISAYGRTWSANTATDKNTIQFSDLLAGQVFSAGSSGSLNVSQVWPNGADEITALAAHNGFLYIFGRRQILVYQGANDPAAMFLADTVSGIGCCARDSVALTGTDVFFLSDSGVRSLARTVQEKSAPFRDISANVRDDLVTDINADTLANIKSMYSDSNAFYLLTFPASNKTYCFDTRTVLPNGAARVTTWDLVPKALFSNREKEVLFGFTSYVGYYTGNLDRTSTYKMTYFSNYFDLGQPSNIKVLKKLGFTLIGGSGSDIVVKYGFDYSTNYQIRNLNMSTIEVSEYGTAEYGIAEYSTGIVFDNQRIQGSGSGTVLQFGLEVTINGFELSVQKLDVFCKLGRTI